MSFGHGGGTDDVATRPTALMERMRNVQEQEAREWREVSLRKSLTGANHSTTSQSRPCRSRGLGAQTM